MRHDTTALAPLAASFGIPALPRAQHSLASSSLDPQSAPSAPRCGDSGPPPARGSGLLTRLTTGRSRVPVVSAPHPGD